MLKKLILTNTLTKLNPLLNEPWFYMAKELHESRNDEFQVALESISEQIKNELEASLKKGSLSLEKIEKALNNALSLIILPQQGAELGSKERVMTFYKTTASAIRDEILHHINNTDYKTHEYSQFQKKDYMPENGLHSVETLIAIALQKNLGYLYNHQEEENFMVFSAITRMFKEGKGLSKAPRDIGRDNFLEIFKGRRTVDVITAISVVSSGWKLSDLNFEDIAKKIENGTKTTVQEVLKELEIIDEYNRLLIKNEDEFNQIFQEKEKENKVDYHKLIGKDQKSDVKRKKIKRFILEQIKEVWKKEPRIKNKLGFGQSILHLRQLDDPLTNKDFELIVDMVKKEPLKYVNLLTITSIANALLSRQQKRVINDYRIIQEEILKYSKPTSQQEIEELETLLKEKKDCEKELIKILTPTINNEEIFNPSLFANKGLTIETVLDRYHTWNKHAGKTAGIGIQDRDFFLCVEYVEGSPLNVAGIPEKELFQFYHEFGILTTPPDILDKYWPHQEEQLKIDSEQTISLLKRHEEQRIIRQKRAELILKQRVLKKTDGVKPIGIIKTKFEAIRCTQLCKEYFNIIKELKYLKKYIKSKADLKNNHINAVKDGINKILAHHKIIKNKFRTKYGYDIPDGYLNRNQFANEDRIIINRLMDELDAIIWEWDSVKEKHWDAEHNRYRADNLDTPVAFKAESGIENDILHRLLDLNNTSSWDENKNRHLNGFMAFQEHLNEISTEDIENIKNSSAQYLKEKHQHIKLLGTLYEEAQTNESRKSLQAQISKLNKEILAIEETIDQQYSVVFDSILSGNRESRGVDQVDKMLKDDRKALFEYVSKISKNGQEQQNIVLTVGNSGKEAMMSLWFGYLLLSQGHNVTISAKSKPMNQFDCNILELKYIIHYFDGILKGKSKESKGLGEFAKEGKLTFSEIDDIGDIQNLSVKNSKGEQLQNKLAILTGELWYSNIVGKSDLKEPPYNQLKDTALFSIHVHKTPSKPLAVLDKQVTTRTGDYVDRSITTGWKICQMFLPEAIEVEKAQDGKSSKWTDGWRRYNMKFKPYAYNDNGHIESKESFDLTKMLKDENTKAKIIEQIIKECKSYVGVKELAKELKPHKDGDGFTFQYWTPHKFVEITVTSSNINVELLMDYDDKNERVEREGGTPWDNVKTKIPNLINAVFWGIAKEQVAQKGILLLTNEDREKLAELNTKTATISSTELKPYNVISHEKEILDITIPTSNLNQQLLSEFKGSFMIQVIKKKSNEEYIKELIPAMLTIEGIKCRFTNLTTDMQIVDIIGISNDNNKMGLTKFVDDSSIDNFVYHFSTEKDPNNKQKYNLSKKELTLSSMRKEKVLIAPVDKYTTMENRVKWNTQHNEGNDHVAYTELIRLGCIWSRSHTYNPLYWEDPNYITAIPRMTISSHEGPLVFQLAGPHNLPIEQAEDNIFPDGKGLSEKDKKKQNKRIANYFAKAAQLAEYMGASAIDINMGGPALANQKGGIYLAQESPELAYEIVKAINKAVDIPVCVKTRLFRVKDGLPTVDIQGTVDYIEKMKKAGAKWIAIHTRVWHEGTTSEGKAKNKRNELRQVIQLARNANDHFSDSELKMLKEKSIIDENGYLNIKQFDQLIDNMQEAGIIDLNWEPINKNDFKIVDNSYSSELNITIFDKLKTLRTFIYANGEVYTMEDIDKTKDVGADGVMIWAAMHKDPDAAQKMKRYYQDGTSFTSTITGTKAELIENILKDNLECSNNCTGCGQCTKNAESIQQQNSIEFKKFINNNLPAKREIILQNISSVLELKENNSGTYSIIINQNGKVEEVNK